MFLEFNMRLAALMDPLDKLKPYKDSTLAMLKAGHELGWVCAYFTQGDLFCRSGHAYARMSAIKITDLDSEHWVQVNPMGECPLTDFDIILMRKDPPFDMEYIYATYALDLAEKEGVLVANHPQSLRDANEKFFTLQFPQCCPPTLISRDMSCLRAFFEKYRNVIYKPLEGMGGSSVFHVNEQASNLSVILEILSKNGSAYIMAQQYIPEIKTTGDKRILLLNGEPIPYALARIPAEGELRGNLAAGARGEVVPLTEKDRWICTQIAPTLREKGLFFVGIDVIGDYLTEINVTSPTCLQEIARATGLDIAKDYLGLLASFARKKERRNKTRA
jgi:glutathione synthase